MRCKAEHIDLREAQRPDESDGVGSHPLDRRTGRERRSYAEQSFRLHRFKHGGTRPTRLREYLGLTGTKFGCGIGMCNKNADELAALWAEYGDPKVAEWDEAAQKPRAKKRGPVASD